MISNDILRRGLLAAAVTLLALAVLGTGQVAAHNPACIQTGHWDGPHYDGDSPSETTASASAYYHNPTLRNPLKSNSLYPSDNANSIFVREGGGCSVGDSQSPHSGH